MTKMGIKKFHNIKKPADIEKNGYKDNDIHKT